MNRDRRQTILPPPDCIGDCTVARAINRRRSVRDYGSAALTLPQVSQLLWAGQGITGDNGLRSTPSAGGLHPLTLTLAAGRVDGLCAGVHRYACDGHRLVCMAETDVLPALARAAIEEQPWLAGCAAVIAIGGRSEPGEAEFAHQPPLGERAFRYLFVEVGHVSQNIYLQATALELGTLFVGAFDDTTVARLLGLDADERVFGLMPIGPPAGPAMP